MNVNHLIYLSEFQRIVKLYLVIDVNDDVRLLSTLEALMFDADLIGSGVKERQGVITALTALSLTFKSGLSVSCGDLCSSNRSAGGIVHGSGDSSRPVLPSQRTAQEQNTKNEGE